MQRHAQRLKEGTLLIWNRIRNADETSLGPNQVAAQGAVRAPMAGEPHSQTQVESASSALLTFETRNRRVDCNPLAKARP